MPDDELEITLTDDPPAPDTTTTPDPPAPLNEVADGVAELQRKLDESERARAAAVQRADEATRRATTAEGTAHGSQIAVIMSALDTIEANATTLKAQMAEALAAGDFAKHSDLNGQLVEQAAQKVELQRGKAALEAQQRQPAAPAQPTPAQLTDVQKVELYTQNMLPRAAAWVRAHPQYVTDPRLNDRLLAKHYAAKDAGHVEGSDSYFQFIETGLGMTGNGAAAPTAAPAPVIDPTAQAAQPVRQRDAQPSPAPPSRGGGGSRTIRLTPSEQEAARMSGQTYEEYAKIKDRLQRSGEIGKNRVH